MKAPEAAPLHGLDDTDLRILRSLQANPRKPVSRIAREVGLTDNAIRYRLKRMQAAGIIRGFVMVVDPKVHSKPILGLLLAKTRDVAATHAAIEAMPQVVGIYECSGPYNLFMVVRTTDETAIEDLCKELHRLGAVDSTDCLLIRDIRKACSATIPESTLPPSK